MVAKFDIYSWKDILRVAGTIAATSPKERVMTKYMDFHFPFPGNSATVYGCNIYQASKLTVPCETRDIPDDYHLLVLPQKVPPHTRSVEIHINAGKKSYSLMYIDSENDIIDACDCEMIDGDPVDYESLFKKALDNFERESTDSSGKYYIVANPRYLMNALEGMKQCDSVILNFGNQVQPFTIRPWGDNDENITALVLPVRCV